MSSETLECVDERSRCHVFDDLEVNSASYTAGKQ